MSFFIGSSLNELAPYGVSILFANFKIHVNSIDMEWDKCAKLCVYLSVYALDPLLHSEMLIRYYARRVLQPIEMLCKLSINSDIPYR